MANKKVFTTLDMQAGTSLKQPRLHPASSLPNSGLEAGQAAVVSGKLHITDGTNWYEQYSVANDATITGELTFNRGASTAPFSLHTNAQGQLVAGLNADKLDGYDARNALNDGTTHSIPRRDSNNQFHVGIPTEDTHVVNKKYADTVAQGLSIKTAVRCATTASVTIGTGLNVGDTIDGVTLADGDRVLVKNNSSHVCGVYVAGSSPARATDYDSASEINDGDFFFVQEGTTNGNKGFVQTKNVADLGTDPIAFEQFSEAGNLEVYSQAGTAAASKTAGPLIQVGNDVTFKYSSSRFQINSGALDIQTNSIQSAQLGTNSVTPTQLQDTGSFTMGGLTVNGEITGQSLVVDNGSTSPVDLQLKETSTAYHRLGLRKSGSRLDIGEYNNDGTSITPILSVQANGDKVGIGQDATSPSGTMHVSTARYSTTNEITDGNAISTSNWSTSNSSNMLIGTPTNKAQYEDGAFASLAQTGIFNQATDVGKRYKLTFTIEAKSGVTFTSALLWIGRQDGGQDYVPDTDSNGNNAYNDYGLGTHEVFFDLPTHASNTGLAFYAHTSGSAFVISNISLYEDTLSTSGSATFANLSVNSAADDLVIANNDDGGITLINPNNKKSQIFFADKNQTHAGGIIYDHGNATAFKITTGGGTDALSIDTSQNAKFEQFVGINGMSASDPLSVKSEGQNDYVIRAYRSDATETIFDVHESSLGDGAVFIRDRNNSPKVKLYSNGTSSITGGPVAIGGTSADLGVWGDALTIHAGSAAAGAALELAKSGSLYGFVGLQGSGSGHAIDIVAYQNQQMRFKVGSNGATTSLIFENDGTHDHKANSIVNSATVAGLQDGGACYDFDGAADYIQYNEDDVFSDQTSGSISVWFKTSYSGNYQYLVSSGDDSTQNNITGFAIQNGADGNELYFYSLINGGSSSLVKGSTSVADGKWHHAVAVSTGTEWKIYLDGVEESLTVAAGTNSGAWFGDVPDRNGFDIGRYRRSSPTYYFNGQIRDVKIFPSVLSAGDIRKLYSGENPKKNLNVELVTNGTFDSDYSGWSAGAQSGSAPSLSISSSRLLVVNNATGNVPYAVYAATTVSGRMYKFQADVIYSNATIDVAVDSGTSGGTNLIDGSNVGSSATEGTQTYFFTATSTTTYLSLRVLTTSAGANGLFDNISLQEVGTLVDLTPQSASSTQWRNEAIPALYNGTVNNATLSQGNTYWNNIKQDGDSVEFKNNIGIGTAPTTWKATISDGTTTGFINAYNNALSFGTNTDHALKLYQNGTVAFQLDANGNTKVENKLGVGGVAATGAYSILCHGGSVFEDTMRFGDEDGSKGFLGWNNIQSSPDLAATQVHNHFRIGASKNATNAGISFVTRNGGDVNAGVISREGYWGIGKTSVASGAQLEVHNAASHSAIHITTAGTNKNVDLKLAPSGTGSAYIAYGGSAGNNLDFYSYKTGVQSVLVVDGDGTQDHKANSIVNSATVAGLQDGSACYDFDGTNDFIQSPITTALDAKAVSVWFKPSTAITKDTSGQWLIGFDDSGYADAIVLGSNTSSISNEIITLWAGSKNSYASATASISAEWHHLVVTYNATDSHWDIYLDGVVVDNAYNGTANTSINVEQILIGARPDQTGNRFNGQIRDVKIFPSELDAADIRKLYAGENPKKNSNVDLLLGYGDGESGNVSNWTNQSGATISSENSTFKVTSTGSFVASKRSVATTEGKVYKVSALLKYGSAGALLEVTGTGLSGINSGTVTNLAFERKTIIFTATSSTSVVELQVQSGSGGEAYFDDITFEEVGTLVDFTPQSASSSKWRNEALLGFYDGTVNNATLSQGNSYWNNIKQDGETVSIGNPVNPSAKLHINEDSTDTPLQITRASNSGNGMIKFETGTTGDWIVGLRNSPANSDFRFYSYGAAADALTITRSSGDVKIASKLGVGTSATFTDSQVAVVGDDNVGIALQSTHSGKTSRIRFFDNSGNQDATVGFANDTSNLFMGTGTNTHFVINQSGNVSIGADSPSSKLDVYTDGDNKWNSSFLRDVAVDAWTGVHIGYGWHENNIYRKSGIAFKRTVANNALGELHIINDGTADSANGLSASRQASVQYWDYDGTQNHQGNRIVNSQTLNDSWRSSEPSLRFDGVNDVVNVGTGVLAHENITISLWVKPEDKDSPGLQGLVTNNSTGNDRRDLCINNNRFEFAQTTSNSSHLITSTTAQCREGVWQHVVVTSATDGSDTDVVMYVDGVSVATKTISGDVMTDIADACKIGYLNSNRYFNGEIKEVRIHNRALGAEEIKGLYNGESTPWYYADASETKLTSDFSSGTNGFTAAGGTVTGNVDGIDGAQTTVAHNDTLKFVVDSGTSPHQAIKVLSGLTTGRAYKITGKVYIPTGNSDVDGVQINEDGNGNVNVFTTITTTGDWVEFSGVQTWGGYGELRFRALKDNGGTHSYAGNGSDKFYLKDIVLEEAGEVAAYTPKGISGPSASTRYWLDNTTNENHGTITGATTVGNEIHGDLKTHFLRIGTDTAAPTWPNYGVGLECYYDSDSVVGGTTGSVNLSSYKRDATAGYKGVRLNGKDIALSGSGTDRLVVNHDGTVKASSAASDNLIQVARVQHYVIEPIANNTSEVFVMNHALNTEHIIVQVHEEAAGLAVVETDIRRGKWYTPVADSAAGTGVTHGEFNSPVTGNTSHNFVSIIFATAPASTSKYRVTIIS